MPTSSTEELLYEHPVELLRTLVRFDTTNPPGDEADCIGYLYDVLAQAGFEPKTFACDEARPNLVVRLGGQGQAPPLLMYGHVDVVSTEGQEWTHPPFEGRVVDDYVWGRGTLDMKGGIVMMLAALLRAKAEGFVPPGDVIMAAVCDEEVRGECGARFLVENYAELFEGVRYAISEFGGATMHLGGQRLYPIMVAEKQTCQIRATLRGQAGHGSMPVRGGAMAKLADLLQRLDRQSLPVHVTPVARGMIEGIASALSFPKSTILRQLLNPSLTDRILSLLGSVAGILDPILRNTVSPTILHASEKFNVIPGQVTVGLDGRLLPGFTPDDLLAELRQLGARGVEWEVLHYFPGPPESDMGLFNTLAGILQEGDPGSVATPLLIAGATDARHFSRLGIQTYGFTPIKMPADMAFWQLMHGADERIPVEGLEFGVEATYRLLRRFGETT